MSKCSECMLVNPFNTHPGSLYALTFTFWLCIALRLAKYDSIMTFYIFSELVQSTNYYMGGTLNSQNISEHFYITYLTSYFKFFSEPFWAPIVIYYFTQPWCSTVGNYFLQMPPPTLTHRRRLCILWNLQVTSDKDSKIELPRE